MRQPLNGLAFGAYTRFGRQTGNRSVKRQALKRKGRLLNKQRHK